MTHYEFAVDGMCCGSCENAITTAVGDSDSVSGVTADSDANTVTILASDIDKDEVRASIENAGFAIA